MDIPQVDKNSVMFTNIIDTIDLVMMVTLKNDLAACGMDHHNCLVLTNLRRATATKYLIAIVIDSRHPLLIKVPKVHERRVM